MRLPKKEHDLVEYTLDLLLNLIDPNPLLPFSISQEFHNSIHSGLTGRHLNQTDLEWRCVMGLMRVFTEARSDCREVLPGCRLTGDWEVSRVWCWSRSPSLRPADDGPATHGPGYTRPRPGISGCGISGHWISGYGILWNIKPGDINPWEIRLWDIWPWNIRPWNIKPWDMRLWDIR